jgi:prostaglandin-H2 D-isomerase / glutathione transferase
MTLTLYYLPLRARLEFTRMILEHGNVPYEYVELTFAEWAVAKEKNEICHFNQLPSIKTQKGTVISQSGAIVRYAAKLAGCFPADIDLAAEADMILELTQEMNLINPVQCYFTIGSDAYKENYATFFKAFPKQIAAAQRILRDRKFYGGDEPHYGDFALFHICNSAEFVAPGSLDLYPAINAWYKTMLAIPSIAAYLAKRPNASTEGFGVPNTHCTTI